MKKLLLIIAIALFILSGCGGSGIPKVGRQQGSLTLKMSESGVKAQTIEPDLDLNIATYDIAGSGPLGASFNKYNVQAGSSVTITALAVGPWTISVDAKNSDGTNIAAGFSQVYVTAGGPTSAEVTVQPLEGNGALSLQVSWPSGLITVPVVAGTLIPQNGGASIFLPFTVSGETATSATPNLAAGYYTLQVKLQDGAVDQWGAADVVRIISGQTTNGGFPLNTTTGKTGKIELVIVPDLQNPITIDFSGQQETLASGTEMTVTANPSAPVDSYQWYLNGELLPDEARGSITIGSTLNEGSYRLDLVVTKGNIAGAGSISFKVSNSPDVWANSYGGPGNEVKKCSQKTPDGGIIMGGASDSFGSGNYEMWLVKLNSSGAIEWQKTYGGATAEEAVSIASTSDGGFIVAGTTGMWTVNSNIVILKLNQNGDIQWQKTIGGSNLDEARCIKETSDHGFIISGCTLSFGAGLWDCWIIKLNNSGNVEWQRSYGGSDLDYAVSICETINGGYIVGSVTGGNSTGQKYLVFKINSIGTIEWQETFGSYADVLNNVIATSDGKYIVSGSTQSNGNGGYSDFWLLKLNTNGSIIWQKTYGGLFYDNCCSVEATSDGALMVSGQNGSFDSSYNYYGWILKLDSNGGILWQKLFLTPNIDNILVTLDISDGLIATGSSLGLGDFYALKLRSDGTCPPLTVDTDITPMNTYSSCTNANLTTSSTNALIQGLNFDVTITNATPRNITQ